MPSQLDTSRTIIARGVFDGLQSFAQLEERISTLGVENTKISGDAFEIFIEGYIATQQKLQSERNWVVGRVPPDVRNQLNLSGHGTLGIDGVFKSRTGDFVPYQVKFRSGRPVLSYNEVASFLGITERARDRIIFTNSNEMALDAKNRDGMRTVRGIDFDDLTQDDFAAIEAWLKEKPAPVKQLSPRPYQQEAIDGIYNTLSEHDRATAVLACGTGKTLIALWVAEKMRPKSVLVLLPSLTLVQQTLGEWSRHNSWRDDFTFICVCSDRTVTKNDDIELSGMDVDFPVSTDASDVRRFLERPSGKVKVVFSTYQSSPIVAEGARGLNPFDIAVFDEAHKTTGPQAGLFATALHDEKINIGKRLFLTATPRHYRLGSRDKDGDLKVVSMDNEAIYGPRAYTLTFGDAARQGIICDYKVIVAVVEGAQVNQFCLQHGVTLVDGEQIGASWVAKQIAVQRAVEETGAKRAISFHSRVSMAKDFSSNTALGIGQYLEGFATFHASGEQKSFERKQILNAFRDAPKALITNARCLTEGIDIPAVDMVAFVDPRSSRVDIAQAAGRAMRKPLNSDKTVGFVVVPLFVERDEGETIEEALERTNYVDVMAVLNAMREQDDELTDIIQQSRQASGRGEIFNPKPLAEKIQISGPEVSLEVLQASIFAQIVEQVGDSWDGWFGRLQAFKAREGHCRVPATALDGEFRLGQWVSVQRTNRDKLTEDRRRRLDALDFVWSKSSKELELWNKGFKYLEAFKAREGHCRVPLSTLDGEFRIGQWVLFQRRAREELTKDRRALLDAVGFVWDDHAGHAGQGRYLVDLMRPEQENYLPNLIRHRAVPFASGVVGGPFRKLCDLLVTDWGGVRLPKAALLHAFKEAGWVDCGRLGSADFHTKRHIFAAPDVAKANSKSDLRRMAENIEVIAQTMTREELTEDRRPRSDAVGFVWDEQSEQWGAESYLADLIRHRVAPFASGVVGGPFHKLCDLLVTEGKVPAGVKVTQAALLHAFKEAGWVDYGRLGSADFHTKRHIFAAPDVARVNSKSELRRAVETIEVMAQTMTRDELTEDRRPRSDAVGFVWDEQTEQRSYLPNLIRHRVAPFASGVVGGPFHKLCDLLVTEGKVPAGVKVTQAALLDGLKAAGWVDCGRLGSVDFQTKRHIFAAPDVARVNSKSDLRRMVESIDTT
jgi:superfamily II DNA or RNA helicase